MNNVSIVGRLTKPVELKYTGSGVAVASGTVAVDRQFKNQNGEKETDFINFVAWKHTAEALANFTDKGHRVGITGRIQTRNYEGQNGRVFVTEVVAEQVTFLEPKGNNSPKENKGNAGASKPSNDPFAGGYEIDSSDLPF